MKKVQKYDIICVGGGIMSTSLCVMAKLLNPDLKIAIFERLDHVALESSAAWNNAGTGHSAYCELNYTPIKEDGVDMSKAVKVCSQFEISKQFWAFLLEKGFLREPSTFINQVPHHSWVKGADNVAFLKQRFEKMKDHFMFDTIQYTEDHDKMKEWFPLIMQDRTEDEIMAATRIEQGTEMNFGTLTEGLARILDKEFDTPIHYNHEVLDIDPDETIDWTVEIKDLKTKEIIYCDSEHVFIGAGGGALPLLQKVEIEEKKGYGGFPVSGQWLVCKNREIINKHQAKVYSKAEVGSPPMSVPHLDTRYIKGRKELLFGPFAGFSTKFLKEGSALDLPMSIKFDNIPSMWGAFWHNLDLTKYLIEQVTKSHSDRVDDLKVFMKDAREEDWELLKAGQRVQIIKRDEEKGGTLEFGTEVVSSADGKITALLGASPGASTAVAIMMEVLEKAFGEIVDSEAGKKKIQEIIPLYAERKNIDPVKYKEVQRRVNSILKIKNLKEDKA